MHPAGQTPRPNGEAPGAILHLHYRVQGTTPSLPCPRLESSLPCPRRAAFTTVSKIPILPVFGASIVLGIVLGVKLGIVLGIVLGNS